MAKKASRDEMSDVFKQLADASRLSVLYALFNGRRSVGEICKATSLSQPNVSHHLAQLKSIGLVNVEKKGQKALYSIADAHVYKLMKECEEHVRQGVRI
jgi:DNA-binding transcriptional ArsR family regulator